MDSCFRVHTSGLQEKTDWGGKPPRMTASQCGRLKVSESGIVRTRFGLEVAFGLFEDGEGFFRLTLPPKVDPDVMLESGLRDNSLSDDHRGYCETMIETYHLLYIEWLPDSDREPKSEPSLELYSDSPKLRRVRRNNIQDTFS